MLYGFPENEYFANDKQTLFKYKTKKLPFSERSFSKKQHLQHIESSSEQFLFDLFGMGFEWKILAEKTFSRFPESRGK